MLEADSPDYLAFGLPHVRDWFRADAYRNSGAPAARHDNTDRDGDFSVCGDADCARAADFDGDPGTAGHGQADRDQTDSTDRADAHRNGAADGCA